MVEVKDRRTGERETIPLPQVVHTLRERTGR